MKQVTVIGPENNQVFTMNTEDGKTVYFLLKYKENQSGWFITIECDNFMVNNLRVVTSGNMLHQFRNIITFGLRIDCEGDSEPALRDDFSSKRATMYLLNSSEVEAFSEVISGQATA